MPHHVSLKKNVIANYLGQGWAAVMGLAFVPIYIKYLGIEAYGLIGIFAVLLAWLTLLDMGMTPTLNREMARFTGGAHSAQSIRDLLRSIEVIVVGAAIIIAAGIWAASGWLASDWLKAEKLSIQVVAQAFTVMGVVAALRFVEGIYRSSIVGLQKQVLVNVVYSGLATLRGLGAVAVLAWISPTIRAFFLWQGIISIVGVSILAFVTYRSLPKAEFGGRFSLAALRAIKRFAGGVLGITFLALLLTQADKIILSNLLSLSEFGYYALGSAVAGGLYMLGGPVTQAWFPRLSQLHVSSDLHGFIRAYHQGAQLVAVMMGSAAMVLIIFAGPILQLWTHDAGLTRRAAAFVSLLALGNLLNGLMLIPMQAQLAYGWTSLMVKINIISVVLIVPSIVWVTLGYGALGAAWVWVGLNSGYVLLGIHFMYRRILITEKWKWYFEDTLQPLLAAFLVAGVSAWCMPRDMGAMMQLVWLLATGCFTLLASSLAANTMRGYALNALKEVSQKNRH